MAPHKALPSFATLLKNYPHNGGPEVPKTLIGGQVNAAWITDTCTIRMSRAMNYSGFPLPARGTADMHVIQGGDHKPYAFRVAEMRKWLRATVGPPTHHNYGGPPIDKSPYVGKIGIIAFKIHYAARPGEATAAAGHIDLWDGSSFAGEYSQQGEEDTDFAAAQEVEFWLTPP